MDQKKERSSFTGKLGFILAAAGSAVGLGNIWRFPYLAAQYGGGIFLLVYLVLAVTFGFSLMVTEISIGRKTGLSAIGAYKKLDGRFSFLGYVASIVPIIIMPYYSVIGGWILKYLTVFFSGQGLAAATDGYFGAFISSPWQPSVFFAIFAVMMAIVIFLGVDKGVENVSKFAMPVLIVLTIGISVYCCFIPGALDGIRYYIVPDFSKFSVKTVVAAMGQLFYSMSLAMGIMITYGSYMKKDIHIEKSVRQIEIFDTGIAFLAGFMIIPAVVALMGEENLNAGAGLMFVTLPKVFAGMPGGQIIGALFFFLVLFAALTSAISLMETVVSIFVDITKADRKLVTVFVIIGMVLLAIPSLFGYSIWADVTVLGLQFLDFFDFISNNVIMPVVALITCILIGYVIKPTAIIEEVESNGPFTSKKLFTIVIRYIAPVCLVIILVWSVFGTLVNTFPEAFSGDFWKIFNL